MYNFRGKEYLDYDYLNLGQGSFLAQEDSIDTKRLVARMSVIVGKIYKIPVLVSTYVYQDSQLPGWQF